VFLVRARRLKIAAMKKEGTIVRWDDARGFGFIRSPASTADLFVHVRDFRSTAGSPRQGMQVTFEEIHVGGKGPRAMAVQPAGPARAQPSRPQPAERRKSQDRSRGDAPSSGAAILLPLMVAYAALLGWAAWGRLLPVWVLGGSALVNFWAFMMYWYDKYAAQKDWRRTPEKVLHYWSLAGGWGGAWLAQVLLRHKSRKESFRATYFVTVALHCAAVAGWVWWRHRAG
jgi:uncharacterized membrane protein YsdA (DUF1294 family)/cold shock CspA family protein